jgi:chemotaxis protein MotB
MAKGKEKECEEGAPGWIVTFSDLMSLLLTFFILLLSFSTISEEEFNEAMMSLHGALGVMPRMTSVISVAPKRPRRPSEEQETTARRMQRNMQIQGKKDDVKISYDALGGIKINLPAEMLFGPGGVTLLPEAAPVLRDLAEIIGEMPETFVEVRGHTDSQNLSSSSLYNDNAALSFGRADTVADTLALYGRIPEEQFERVACGPSQPVASNDTAQGRAANRRVEIFVRGLVDKAKIEMLQSGFESLDDLQPRTSVPFYPPDFNSLLR